MHHAAHAHLAARPVRLGGALLLALLPACGGGDGGGGSQSPAGGNAPAFSSVPAVQVSQASSYAADCGGAGQTGTLYPNTALEPSLVVNPTNSANLVAEWQQDRWSTGGSQALNLAASFDAGKTWTLSSAAFSLCTGGSVAAGSAYARASNGWLTVAPNGVVYALSLSFSGNTLAAGSSSAQLVASSSDGGMTWGPPTALISDGSGFFDDKGSITADPNDANYVYAVWDRLEGETGGPSYFAVTADAGATWQSAVSIYDPGLDNQTIGNQIVVLPGDVLLDVFTQLSDLSSSGSAALAAVSSSDHGTSWSAPLPITSVDAVSTLDPLGNQPVRDAANLFSVAVSAGGTIYIVWQDARFSGGQYNGIAMTQSSDGGQSWSTPVQVNADHATPAFTPTVTVRADGLLAITYYDFRNDVTPGAALADYWLVTSSDGSTFKEAHLSGPFNLELAPDASGEGLFLGDYQSLRSNGAQLLPIYAQTPDSASNAPASSNIFLAAPPAADLANAAVARTFRAAPARPQTLGAAARARMAASVRLTRAQRLQHAP
jgi:hypothetical protein